MGETRVATVENGGGAEVALATVSRGSGVMALATMTDQDFAARLILLKKGQERVRLIQRELMEPDEDYGVIPGTKKPTLLKPGAEKLRKAYGLVPTYELEWIEGDGQVAPTLRCRVKCTMHEGDEHGPVAGFGVGAANSWEKKHRYRGGQRTCPACGCEGTIRRSRFEDRDTGDKGWYCHDKAGGCGQQFWSGDPAITEQQVGQVENPDPFDVENTVFKMAKKRALIDATLDATATSGLFTQDLEDTAGEGHEETARRPGPSTAAAPPSMAREQREKALQPQAQRATATGKLPAWTEPCPRCGVKRTVIVSKQKIGTYCCWKGGKPAGCGYVFTPEDAQRHAGAAAQRQASGAEAPQNYSGPEDEGFQVTDEDVPF